MSKNSISGHGKSYLGRIPGWDSGRPWVRCLRRWRWTGSPCPPASRGCASRTSTQQSAHPAYTLESSCISYNIILTSLQSVLRIRIRGLESEMEKNPDPGSAVNIADHITKSLVIGIAFGLKCLTSLSGSGSGIRCLFDPGSGIEILGSRINITDSQHCLHSNVSSPSLLYTHVAYFWHKIYIKVFLSYMQVSPREIS